ncbi:VanZ family protein [Myxococcota bacterium]|nr:VanZ family protein [Myxococcota bacterium]MBU1381314.1 VanZ family protein [Myxococcota bacterium]MBU1495691.1 VanZ family protein [Myxococcota bacterium]
MKQFIWNHTVTIFYFAQALVTAILVISLRLDHTFYRVSPLLMALPGVIFFIPGVQSSKSNFIILSPVIWYGTIISLLSSISSVPSTGISGNVFHPIEFAALSFIMLHSFARLNEGSPGLRKPIILTLLICTIFALLDELHQYFIPGRYADPFDVLLDITGSIAGIVIYMWFRRLFRTVTNY